jgi:amino-acid N-acetyltransferase
VTRSRDDGPAVAPTLRPATRADLDAVERLLAESGLPVAGVAVSLATFVVAETISAHGRELVGVAGLELCRDNALLRSVAVRPGWQRHGLGRALVGRVIAEAEARHLHALYLLTTTAARYFPAFGFRETARAAVPDDVRATEEFTSACPASAIVMVRAVAGTPGKGAR